MILTKTQILSDLHLEFGNFEPPNIKRDLLILAGDIHVGKNAADFLAKQTKKSPVIYIIGNHEFYGHDLDEVYNFWRKQEIANLHVLENREFQYKGVRFLGCCLWTNFNGGSNLAMRQVQGGLADYKHITIGDRRLKPEDTYNIHNDSITWLTNQLSTPFSGKTVVITHHLPSYQSVALRFRPNPVRYGFFSDLDYLIEKYQPNLWIHGHTHDSFNYRIGNTRVVCNPRGYFRMEENLEFNPKLTFQL